MSYSITSVRKRGLSGDGTTSENAALTSLNTSGFPLNLNFTKGSYRITANITITNHITMAPGASFTIDSGVTLTIAAGFTTNLRDRVFFGSGSVVFAVGSIPAVYSEWWGAIGDGTTDDTSAITSARTTCLATTPPIPLKLIAGKTYAISQLQGATNWIVDGDGSNLQHNGNNNPLLKIAPNTPGTDPAVINFSMKINKLSAKQSATNPTTSLVYITSAFGHKLEVNDIQCGNSADTVRYSNYGIEMYGRSNQGIYWGDIHFKYIHGAATYGINIDGYSSTYWANFNSFNNGRIQRCGSVTATRDANNQITSGGAVRIVGGLENIFRNVDFEANQGPAVTFGDRASSNIFRDCWAETNNSTWAEVQAGTFIAAPQFNVSLTADASTIGSNIWVGVVDHLLGGQAISAPPSTDNNLGGLNPQSYWGEFTAPYYGRTIGQSTEFMSGLEVTRPVTGQDALRIRTVGDTYPRLVISANGTLTFGPGNVTPDIIGWQRNNSTSLGLPSTTRAVASGGLTVSKDFRDSQQSIAYTASISPDPTLGKNVIVGQLTGNVSFYQGANNATGQYMTLYLQQDSTGGRTIANWGSAYATKWQPNTTPLSYSSITFYYDGSYWKPVAASPSLWAKRILTKTTNYTATIADYTVLMDATSGALTVTLPLAASASNGDIINIKKIDTSTNVVSITGTSGELIDGVSSVVLGSRGESFTIQSDSTTWWVI